MKWAVIRDYGNVGRGFDLFETKEEARNCYDDWLQYYTESNLSMKIYLTQIVDHDETTYDEDRW